VHGLVLDLRRPVLRAAVVVEDDLLVEVLEAHGGGFLGGRRVVNVRRSVRLPGGRRRAAGCRRSSLYRYRLARTVALTPRQRISGLAQWWPTRTQTPCWSSIAPMSCGWMPFERERDRSGPRLGVGGAVQREPVDVGQRLEDLRGELALVRADGVHADVGEVVDRGADPGGLGDLGVPASNLCGTSFQVAWSSVTSRIISPPVRNGGISSSSSGVATSAPIPVGPSILCP
jgi:hypothetical protein